MAAECPELADAPPIPACCAKAKKGEPNRKKLEIRILRMAANPVRRGR